MRRQGAGCWLLMLGGVGVRCPGGGGEEGEIEEGKVDGLVIY